MVKVRTSLCSGVCFVRPDNLSKMDLRFDLALLAARRDSCPHKLSFLVNTSVPTNEWFP